MDGHKGKGEVNAMKAYWVVEVQYTSFHSSPRG